MPTEAKKATVAELKEEFSAAKATIVADYRGLTVADIQAVRRALRSELLDGPTALAMGQGDEVVLARTFLDAIRAHKSVVVRGAVLSGKRVDSDSVTRLATLPSRETLLAQLAGGMASPLSSMASLFAAPLRNLGYAMSQLAEQKGQQAA
jgi:large subunit ribosomal protein L10